MWLIVHAGIENVWRYFMCLSSELSGGSLSLRLLYDHLQLTSRGFLITLTDSRPSNSRFTGVLVLSKFPDSSSKLEKRVR